MTTFAKPPRIAVTRIGEKQPEVRDALVDLEGQINSRLAAIALSGNFVGQPFPIYTKLVDAGLELGEKFAPCDGRTIRDKKSPFHGRTVDAVSEQLGAAAGTFTWFVRIKD